MVNTAIGKSQGQSRGLGACSASVPSSWRGPRRAEGRGRPPVASEGHSKTLSRILARFKHPLPPPLVATKVTIILLPTVIETSFGKGFLSKLCQLNEVRLTLNDKVFSHIYICQWCFPAIINKNNMWLTDCLILYHLNEHIWQPTLFSSLLFQPFYPKPRSHLVWDMNHRFTQRITNV